MSGHLNNEDSEFVSHLPCEKCGSSDANSLYSDGHTYCFSCNTYANTNENISINMENTKKDKINLLDGTPKPLVKRNLTLETCVFWNYYIGEQNNQTVQIANYYNKAREPVFQKIRYKDKTFKTTGNIKEALLYGQEKWNGGGKIVCICEGEIDTMSLSQIFNHKYPVVGIPNGVNGAVKSIKKELEYLESFQNVVLMFDNDEAGNEASIECAHAGVTTGEWTDTLRKIYGEYRAPTGVGKSTNIQKKNYKNINERINKISSKLKRRVKILVGKPGLDGHSSGAEQISVAARDVGMEVVYQGIRLTPDQIVNTAIEESVHMIALSILSGSHLTLTKEIL